MNEDSLSDLYAPTSAEEKKKENYHSNMDGVHEQESYMNLFSSDNNNKYKI